MKLDKSPTARRVYHEVKGTEIVGSLFRVWCLSELRKLECFKHALVVGDVTPSVAHLRIRASAPSFFASVSVSGVLGNSVALSIAVGLRRSRRV